MFVSFFPRPKLFFLSAAGWSLALILFWFFGGAELGALVGLPPDAPGTRPIIGIAVLWSKPFLWFYIYYALGVALFLTGRPFWARLQRWLMGTVLGFLAIRMATDTSR